MNKVFVIIERYDDYEGYTHHKLYNYHYYSSKEDGQKEIDRKVKECQEEWEPEPDLYVEELSKAMEG